jgi:hypothetical protein
MLRLSALIAVMMISLWVDTLGAQTLFAVVLGNQKYVVGSSTLRSGLFRSGDGGDSWEHLGPENLKSYSMDGVDREGGRVLYIAAGNGVHRSLDSGRTWRIVTGWEMTEVLDVMVLQSDPRWVFAATAWGLWASSDSGDSWRRIVNRSPGVVGVEPRYCYRLFATDEGITILADSAIYTIEIRDDIPILQRRAVVAEPRAILEHVRLAGTVVATTHLRGYEPGSYKPHLEQNKDIYGIEQAPEGVIYDLVEQRQQERFHEGAYPIWMASEEGIFMMHPGLDPTWRTVVDGLPQQPVHTLAWVPRYNRLVAGTFGEGLFRLDGNRWIPSGLDGSQVWRLVVKQW